MKNNFKSQKNNMERIREVENFVQYLNEQFYVLLRISKSYKLQEKLSKEIAKKDANKFRETYICIFQRICINLKFNYCILYKS